ncbi:MAG: MFS transporter [Bacteroidaceae bacterium]
MVELYTASYKRSVLTLTCLAAGLVPFMGASINLALPQIAIDYDMNSIGQSWMLTSFLLAAALFQVPFGRLADILGRKKVFRVGLWVIALSSFACAFPYGSTYMMVCRVFQGIGSAMTFSTGMAILTAVFEPKERGKAMGINVAVVYVSLALGPSLGGWLMTEWGWKSIFVLTSIVSLLAAIGCGAVIKQEWIEARGEHFDWKGTAMFSMALLLLIYGFTILPSWLGFLLIFVGSLLFVAFVKLERQVVQPMLNVNLFFTNRNFTLSSVAALINYATTFPIGFFMSLYLQQVKGLDVQYAGLLMMVQPLTQAVLSPVAGSLSDKISSHWLASIGMALLSISLLSIGLFLTPESSIFFVISVLALFGVGFAAFSSPNTNAIMSSVDKRDYSMASATTGTMRLTGQAFSMGVATMILALFLGDKRVTGAVSNEFMQAMHFVFIVFSVLNLFGIYPSMARKKK